MIPLRDSTPSRTVPIVTISLIIVNVAVFVRQMSLPGASGDQFVTHWALVPARLLHEGLAPSQLLTLVTSMFLHGSVLHVLGNMWFLWLFGDNVEDRLGRPGFLAAYALAGVAAAAGQVAADPASEIPMLGASGAVGGVLGAYVVLFPRARVLALVPLVIIFRLMELPAWFFLGLWFVIQLLGGLGGGGGIAWWAHVFGFAVGLGVGLVARGRDETRRRPSGRGDGWG